MNISNDVDTRKTLRILTSMIETTPDFASASDAEGRLLYINSGGRAMLGIPPAEDISDLKVADVHPDWADDLIKNVGIPAAMKNGTWSGESALLTRDGRTIPVSQVIMVHRAPEGEVEFMSTIMRDISAVKEAEKMVRELSTPVLQITPDVLLLPVIGLIDSARARQLTEQLLDGIQTRRAKVVVLDITGVATIDTAVANHLIATAETARLMGAIVFFTGFSSELAKTLVRVSVDLSAVRVYGDLQSGLEAAAIETAQTVSEHKNAA